MSRLTRRVASCVPAASGSYTAGHVHRVPSLRQYPYRGIVSDRCSHPTPGRAAAHTPARAPRHGAAAPGHRPRRPPRPRRGVPPALLVEPAADRPGRRDQPDGHGVVRLRARLPGDRPGRPGPRHRRSSSGAAGRSSSGGWSEIQRRQPGMMLLIAMAISVAYAASLATTLGWFDLEFWWELAALDHDHAARPLAGDEGPRPGAVGARGARRAAARRSRARRRRRHGRDRARSTSSGSATSSSCVPVGVSPPMATIVDGAAELDESMITGESPSGAPRAAATRVVAGTVATDSVDPGPGPRGRRRHRARRHPAARRRGAVVAAAARRRSPTASPRCSSTSRRSPRLITFVVVGAARRHRRRGRAHRHRARHRLPARARPRDPARDLAVQRARGPQRHPGQGPARRSSGCGPSTPSSSTRPAPSPRASTSSPASPASTASDDDEVLRTRRGRRGRQRAPARPGHRRRGRTTRARVAADGLPLASPAVASRRPSTASRYAVGGPALLRERDLDEPTGAASRDRRSGARGARRCSTSCDDDGVVGALALEDEIRPEAAEAVARAPRAGGTRGR